jgi:hypothetical protein
MTVAGPIVIKLMLVRLFVTNFRTKFHKNPTNVLVSDITSQTGGLAADGQADGRKDGRKCSPHTAFGWEDLHFIKFEKKIS